MVISNAPGLGFSITNVVKTAAKDVYSAAKDPRVQAAAASAAQAYAPDKYAQATQWADRARGLIPPAGAGPVGPMPSADASTPDPDGAPVMRKVGVQKNNFTPFIIGGGILVVALLLLRR